MCRSPHNESVKAPPECFFYESRPFALKRGVSPSMRTTSWPRASKTSPPSPGPVKAAKRAACGPFETLRCHRCHISPLSLQHPQLPHVVRRAIHDRREGQLAGLSDALLEIAQLGELLGDVRILLHWKPVLVQHQPALRPQR